MIELVNCPFCKSDSIGVLTGIGESWVECFNCGAIGPVAKQSPYSAGLDALVNKVTTSDEASKLWNASSS